MDSILAKTARNIIGYDAYGRTNQWVMKQIAM